MLMLNPEKTHPICQSLGLEALKYFPLMRESRRLENEFGARAGRPAPALSILLFLFLSRRGKMTLVDQISGPFLFQFRKWTRAFP
jgi:hypothetical protein